MLYRFFPVFFPNPKTQIEFDQAPPPSLSDKQRKLIALMLGPVDAPVAQTRTAATDKEMRRIRKAFLDRVRKGIAK